MNTNAKSVLVQIFARIKARPTGRHARVIMDDGSAYRGLRLSPTAMEGAGDA
jgi:hypothetical protein